MRPLPTLKSGCNLSKCNFAKGGAEPESETESEPESETESEIKYPLRIGSLQNTQHGVSGVVHIIDDKKIKVQKFAYDGKFNSHTFR